MQSKHSFITSQYLSISLIPIHLCLTQSIHSKTANLSQQDLISKAYTSNLLDLKKSYLSYSFYQELTQEYLSFFSPSSYSNPCTLDILLPLCIKSPQLACIFLSKTRNYFCFYQDSMLVFCKEFQDDLSTCIRHIQVFFSHRIEQLYCLSYKEQIPKLQLPILPLLSLFDSSFGFHLSSISFPITLHHFENINPQKPKSPTQTMLFGISFGICLIALLLISLVLTLYQSHLSNLAQTNSSPPLSAEELKHIDSQNKLLLSSLFDFSLLETQQLFILDRLFPHLNPKNIISIKLSHSSIILYLKDQSDLTTLFSLASSLGYRCKTFKENENLVLEISKI